MIDDKSPQHSKIGFVWIVGAGPGDPGLITLRGRQCIASADVIVYDFLSNHVLLEHARPDAELICVGKHIGKRTIDQEKINEILVRLALNGKKICRLKGGDPFVFGRGGEEALHLAEAGVPYDIVPGVSSAIAVAAYAGIPVTQRGVSSSIHIITGHEDPAKPEPGVDWNAIAKLTGTLVFLMGRKNLAQIAARLLRGRWEPTTPAAVISNGTLPHQRTVVGTLNNIAKLADEAETPSPAVLVVGSVVSLRRRLKWFEDKPLLGRAIVLTWSTQRNRKLAAALTDMGAEVIQAPLTRIEFLARSASMRSAVESLRRVNWIIFTNANSVEAFWTGLENAGKDARALAKTKIAAMGAAAAERLAKYGIRADLIPKKQAQEGLLQAFAETNAAMGKNILLPRPESSYSTLAEGLRGLGARVVEVAAYRMVPDKESQANVIEHIEKGADDLVMFSSSSAVRAFVESAPSELHNALEEIPAAASGAATADALIDMGITPRFIIEDSSAQALKSAILEHFRKTRQRESTKHINASEQASQEDIRKAFFFTSLFSTQEELAVRI
jgi:uroporphyrinogen III methyltransferase/synthase